MIEKAVTQLYDNLKDTEYGSRYTWHRLKELSGFGNREIKQETLYYVANKVCVLLMQQEQKYLETEIGYGKRIIRPNEHVGASRKIVKRSVRIYRKAGEISGSTNFDNLTEREKQEAIEHANKWRTLEMFSKELLKSKRIGTVKKEDVATAGIFLDAIKAFTDKR